jgi:pilus assembly protein CpaC
MKNLSYNKSLKIILTALFFLSIFPPFSQGELPQQVMLRVKVVEVSYDKSRELGIDWTYVRLEPRGDLPKEVKSPFLPEDPGVKGSLKFDQLGIGKGEFEATLEAFVQSGEAKILSEPRIAVVVGKEATITTGDEVPYQTTQVVGNQIVLVTEFKTVGVKLKVKPERIEGKGIQLYLEPEVSGISASTQTVVLSEGQTAELPIFYTRNASTTIVVNDGEPFIIGGLLKEETGKAMRGIPILSRIPLLGFFFRRTTHELKKTNLLFYITPHIIKPEEKFLIPKSLPGPNLERKE